ncbi:MAG: RNA 2'-phosphotransferase [Candidatus Latescibacterota bacterium]|nr:RNA 2'-phosphotransferase [Candidatus Latescibacterota bacterium]
MVDRSRVSKLLSLMLRHKPDEFGLEVDAYGYVPIDQVIQGIQSRYPDVTENELNDLVGAPNQQRFEINEFGIRALYGHSYFVEMDGDPIAPAPNRLYMGTTRAVSRDFATEGIGPGDRYYVHLSLDKETAASRSHEKTGPLVIEILSDKAAEQGINFFLRGEVVLTDEIPADCVGKFVGDKGTDSLVDLDQSENQSETGFGRKPRYGRK